MKILRIFKIFTICGNVIPWIVDIFSLIDHCLSINYVCKKLSQQILQILILNHYMSDDAPPPFFSAYSYHGLQKCLVLISHLIKLVNAATALVSQHQCPGLQSMVPRTPLLGQGDLVLTVNCDTCRNRCLQNA